MRINKEVIPTMAIDEFADKHNLTLTIRERPKTYQLPKYLCSFHSTEVKGNGVLIGSSGNGNTIYEAVNDYISKIEHRTLVVDATSDRSKEIFVPHITEYKENGGISYDKHR